MTDSSPVTVTEVLAIIEEAMNVDKGSLSTDAVLADIDDWDSMAVLMLMAGFDEQLGLVLAEDELEKFVKVQDIVDVVASHGMLQTAGL